MAAFAALERSQIVPGAVGFDADQIHRATAFRTGMAHRHTLGERRRESTEIEHDAHRLKKADRPMTGHLISSAEHDFIRKTAMFKIDHFRGLRADVADRTAVPFQSG